MRRRWSSVPSWLGVLSDLLRFVWSQRLWWLIPIVIVLLLLGGLIIMGSQTVFEPFIYTVF